jgi:hypothetical protein
MERLPKFVAIGLLTVLTLAPLAAHAGAVGGRKTDVDQVPVNSTVRYTLSFRGGEPAVVVAKGDGDIDIEVRDENGNLIAQDLDGDFTPTCSFTPKWTGKFTVRVINSEIYPVDYTFATN